MNLLPNCRVERLGSNDDLIVSKNVFEIFSKRTNGRIYGALWNVQGRRIGLQRSVFLESIGSDVSFAHDEAVLKGFDYMQLWDTGSVDVNAVDSAPARLHLESFHDDDGEYVPAENIAMLCGEDLPRQVFISIPDPVLAIIDFDRKLVLVAYGENAPSDEWMRIGTSILAQVRDGMFHRLLFSDVEFLGLASKPVGKPFWKWFAPRS